MLLLGVRPRLAVPGYREQLPGIQVGIHGDIWPGKVAFALLMIGYAPNICVFSCYPCLP